MKVYVGADHNGFHDKEALVQFLTAKGYDVHDEGDDTLDPSDDFPVFAQRTVKSVLGSDDKHARGILLCGSGQGMCMAANRFKGIRAALGYDAASVRSSRNDDDANILCLPARPLNEKTVQMLAELFLTTPFAGAARYKRRIREMDEMGG